MSRFAAAAVVLGIGAWGLAPAPAAAQFFYGFPRLYAPYPYYPPAYYPPAYYPYYAPPPAYYPPPAPAYYPPPATAAAPASGAPASGAPATAAPATAASITYTTRPAFQNAAGQTCREYKAANGAVGTACEDSAGQWRVAN